MTQGLILFAHGARDPRWSAPFVDIAGRIRGQRGDVQVRLAFLEFMSPDLVAAGSELAAAGCTRVDIVPMFLGTGGHVRRDLPRLVDTLMTAWPEVGFTLHAAIGEVDDVAQAMAMAALAALAAPANPEGAG